jgi:hypothetical protein
MGHQAAGGDKNAKRIDRGQQVAICQRVHTAVEVEAAMAELGREGGVGIIVMLETFTGGYGEAIIS